MTIKKLFTAMISTLLVAPFVGLTIALAAAPSVTIFYVADKTLDPGESTQVKYDGDQDGQYKVVINGNDQCTSGTVFTDWASYDAWNEVTMYLYDTDFQVGSNTLTVCMKNSSGEVGSDSTSIERSSGDTAPPEDPDPTPTPTPSGSPTVTIFSLSDVTLDPGENSQMKYDADQSGYHKVVINGDDTCSTGVVYTDWASYSAGNEVTVFFYDTDFSVGSNTVNVCVKNSSNEIGSDSATITRNSGPSNTSPTAADDSAETSEGTSVTINVLSNDSDSDGDTLSVSSVSDPSNGSTANNGDGTVTYTPVAGFSGNDAFTYIISDGNGATASATVTVTVTANPAPAGNPVATIFSVSDNELDAGEVSLIKYDGDQSGYHKVVINGNNTCSSGVVFTDWDTYVSGNEVTAAFYPSDFQVGTNSVTVCIKNTSGDIGSDSTSITRNAEQVNTNPVAVNDTATTTESIPVTIDVLSNDSDSDGDTISVLSFTTPLNGSVTNSGNGNLTYDPIAGYTGVDTFSYVISDGNGGTAAATVTVTVNEDPTPPPAGAPSVSIYYVSDTELDPDETSQIGYTGDQNGEHKIVINGDDTCSTGVVFTDWDQYITPNEVTATFYPTDFGTGSNLVTVCIKNGNDEIGSDTISITRNEGDVNLNPLATDDNVSTNQDTSVVIPVTANDTDPDGDTISILSNTQPLNGSATDNGDGTITYTPIGGYTGTDVFTYVISDGNGGTAAATVTVTVNAISSGGGGEPGNSNPVANDDVATTTEDTAVAIDVTANDTDSDGDTLTVTYSANDNTEPSNGSVTLSNNIFTYTPNSGYDGTDTFTYTLNDGNGGSDTATVVVTITASGGGGGDTPSTPVPNVYITSISDNDLDSNETAEIVFYGDQDGQYKVSANSDASCNGGSSDIAGWTSYSSGASVSQTVFATDLQNGSNTIYVCIKNSNDQVGSDSELITRNGLGSQYDDQLALGAVGGGGGYRWWREGTAKEARERTPYIAPLSVVSVVKTIDYPSYVFAGNIRNALKIEDTNKKRLSVRVSVNNTSDQIIKNIKLKRETFSEDNCMASRFVNSSVGGYNQDGSYFKIDKLEPGQKTYLSYTVDLSSQSRRCNSVEYLYVYNSSYSDSTEKYHSNPFTNYVQFGYDSEYPAGGFTVGLTTLKNLVNTGDESVVKATIENTSGRDKYNTLFKFRYLPKKIEIISAVGSEQDTIAGVVAWRRGVVKAGETVTILFKAKAK